MTHLHEEIYNLKSRVTEMASAVEEAVGEAVRALIQRDSELARKVIQADRKVDEFEIEVDETVIRLLACYQPMAGDLRFIVNASKISTDLERMGDLARNIAQAAVILNDQPILCPLDEVESLARMSQAMIRDAIHAFVQSDAALARQVCRRDDEVDRKRDRLHAFFVECVQENPQAVRRAISLILVVRGLERLADLSTNIAEDVVHFVEGVIIKHHHEEILRRQRQAAQ